MEPTISCHGKDRFDKRATAVKIAQRMAMRKTGASNVRAYLCDHCKGWHVGNQIRSAHWKGRPRMVDVKRHQKPEDRLT